MKIAILGAGRVGSALGLKLIPAGHELVFVSRNASDEKSKKLLVECGQKARLVSFADIAEAISECQVIVLSLPWLNTEEVLEACGNLSGKIILDAVNPIILGAEETKQGLVIGHKTSAAEHIQRWAPGADVVKIFNTTGWENMVDTIYDGKPVTMMLCGDNDNAKQIASGLARDVGFEPVDVGPLMMAQYLEPMAMMWIHMCYEFGFGANFAFNLVRR